jgi:hypothetical protein
MNKYILIDSNGKRTEINDIKHLKVLLFKLIDLPPSINILKSPDTSFITLGISKEIGYVDFFSPLFGEYPRVATVRNVFSSSDRILCFDSGDTPTPIPLNKCIPINILIRIACDYYTNAEIPDYVSWNLII